MEFRVKREFVLERYLVSDTEVATKKWLKGDKLGKGGFAEVIELMDTEKKGWVAAKVFLKENLARSRHKKKLMQEIKLHRTLRHEHIVRFEHFFEDPE